MLFTSAAQLFVVLNGVSTQGQRRITPSSRKFSSIRGRINFRQYFIYGNIQTIMSSNTETAVVVKRMKAMVFRERLRSSRAKRKGTKWYWYTGVPSHYSIRHHIRLTYPEDLKMHRESTSEMSSAAEDSGEPLLNATTIIAGFANFTTSHGVTHTYFSEGIIKKASWSILSFLCLSLLIAHLIYLTGSFRSFAVTTDINMIAERSLPFPAVTICNNNGIKNSVVPGAIADMIAERKVMLMNGSDTKVSNLDTQTRMTEELAMMTEEEKNATGYSLDEMIIYCSFNGENCDDLDFWSFYHSTYGNCYTFNSGKGSVRRLHHSNLAGPKNGLKLVVNIGVYEYLPSETDEAGVKIVVHPQETMPFPLLSGISAPPGHTSDIAVRKSKVTRLGQLYGNCTTLEMNSENAYADPYDVGYSEWACINTCFQKHMVRMCHCFDPSIPYSNTSDVFKNHTASHPCHTENKRQNECKKRVMRVFSQQRLKCPDCFQQCNQTVYDTYLSTATFPAASYMDDFLAYMKVSHPSLFNKLTEVYPEFPANPDKPISSNFLKLNIFYQELMYTRYTQVPTYDTPQFISDLGGTFGLWIGWSVMTAFEFIGLFSDLCVYLYYKHQRKHVGHNT